MPGRPLHRGQAIVNALAEPQEMRFCPVLPLVLELESPLIYYPCPGVMKQVILKLKFSAVKSLTRMVLEALESSAREIARLEVNVPNKKLPPIREHAQATAERFMVNMNARFDDLGNPRSTVLIEENLEEKPERSQGHIEAALALEGMVAHARNCDIEAFISVTTRLNSLAAGLSVDESNNPLDPEQIAAAFAEAVKIMSLKSRYLLAVYREFNKGVFHKLETVLSEANGILIELGVLPQLDIEARDKVAQRTKRSGRRQTVDAETRAFSDGSDAPAPSRDKAADLFEIMRKLVRGQRGGDTAAATDVNTPLSPEDRLKELIARLTALQNSLKQQGEGSNTSLVAVSAAIDDALRAASSGNAADLQAADVNHFVDLLYQAIGNDNSLPNAIREEIVRTRDAISKIALADPDFFNQELHPARVLLDDIALAGIAWSTVDELENQQLYAEVQGIISRLIQEPNTTNRFLKQQIADFGKFRKQHQGKHRDLEKRILDADEAQDREKAIHEYVTQKINERLVKKSLDPSIRALLDTEIHEFLVRLVIREGPGGASWKSAINTIDILIWTVQVDKEDGDRERFDKINAKLQVNLERVLTLADTSKTRKTKILRQLKQVQDYTFYKAQETAMAYRQEAVDDTKQVATPLASAKPRSEPLAVDDAFLKRVDSLPIGMWLEFESVGGQTIRCTLAVKITSIDKYFFVNAQGVKVVETSRMQLARELKAGSVKIVSDGTLFSRAMEATISELRREQAAQAALAEQAAAATA
jgi:hypothetical protein